MSGVVSTERASQIDKGKNFGRDLALGRLAFGPRVRAQSLRTRRVELLEAIISARMSRQVSRLVLGQTRALHVSAHSRAGTSRPSMHRWHELTCSKAGQASSKAGKGAADEVDWPTYLALRKSRRRYGLLASIPTTALGFTLGVSYFATIEAEPTDLILGIEPVWAYGIATVACVGLGWLSGPSVGNALWRLSHRRLLPKLDAKDKDFYEHVKRNRVNPSKVKTPMSTPRQYPSYLCSSLADECGEQCPITTARSRARCGSTASG